MPVISWWQSAFWEEILLCGVMVHEINRSRYDKTGSDSEAYHANSGEQLQKSNA